MRDRIRQMRQALYEAGARYGEDFEYVIAQKGMFSFTGLSPLQMRALREEYAVYGIENGRICIAGLNENNVDYVAKSLAAVSKTVK